MGTGPAGRSGPVELVDIQGSLLPGSKMIHPDEQEIGQRGQETFMDE